MIDDCSRLVCDFLLSLLGLLILIILDTGTERANEYDWNQGKGIDDNESGVVCEYECGDEADVCDSIAGSYFGELHDGDIEGEVFIFGEKEAYKTGDSCRDAKGRDFIGEEIRNCWIVVSVIGHFVSR